MNIYVDVDNTITETSGMDYQNAKPIYEKIEIINKLFDQGHTITYWTARGSVSGINFYELTKSQLDNWGAKYHNFMVGKPAFDILIDDKTINNINENLIKWVTKEEEEASPSRPRWPAAPCHRSEGQETRGSQ
jgi:hypothetical protein